MSAEEDLLPGTLSIEKSRSAVLIMDYQSEIVAGYAGHSETLLSRAAAVLAAARRAGLRIVYVKVGFRPGYPEVSPRNAGFSSIKKGGRFLSTGAEDIHPAVAPEAGDAVVVKHRVSAFAGTDLQMILRANGIDTLILMGISTSGVMLSTLRQAADEDYRIVVVSDACIDRDLDVHHCLMDKVFPRQATVTSAEALVPILAEAV